jgi:hypothetical protein
MIRTPIQAPNANGNAERWIAHPGDCPDRILILGRLAAHGTLRAVHHGIVQGLTPGQPMGWGQGYFMRDYRGSDVANRVINPGRASASASVA